MINLPRDLLKTEYINNKLNSYEIAKKYNCSATWINTLRKYYGIRTLKRYERNAKQKLSKRQQEYIYGKILGDGCIKFSRQLGRNAFLSVGQSDKSYTEWQYSIMKDFINTEVKVYSDKRTIRKDMHYFKTISHPIFTYLYKEFYPNGVKTVSSKWLDKLTLFSLAIWYMDDGSIAQSNHRMRISTESFSYQEHLLIQRYFEKKWDISVDIKSSPREGKFLLYFSAKERDKFLKLIEPYVIPSMEYKLYSNKGKWGEWTSSEIEYLKRNYSPWQNNWENMLGVLNHSKEAIWRKASYLGLTKGNKI